MKLPFPLLSDTALVATKAYGVLYGHTTGKTDYPHMKDRMAKRAFFLVDRDAVVRAKWVGEDLAVFPSETLLKAAQDLARTR